MSQIEKYLLCLFIATVVSSETYWVKYDKPYWTGIILAGITAVAFVKSGNGGSH